MKTLLGSLAVIMATLLAAGLVALGQPGELALRVFGLGFR